MIKVKDYLITPESFPDGTLRLKMSNGMYDSCNEDIPINIKWLYDNDAELFTLQCLVDKLRDWFPSKKLTLTLPYIPHARNDRAYHSDVFTLKTFCRIINDMNFESVGVLDPHSDVATALLDRTIVHPTCAVDKILKKWGELGKDNVVIMYPDAGAAKKFSSLIQADYIVGNKTRDWATGKIKNYFIETNGIDMKGKTIIIVDDICSYGGTFYFAAKALKELGAGNIFLHVDHCENSVLNGQLIGSDLIKKIYTTDSIFTMKHEMIEVDKRYRI